jgi:hypothetical protein
MAAFGLAIITRSETRLAMAAVLWFVLHQKVRTGCAELHDSRLPAVHRLLCVEAVYAVLYCFVLHISLKGNWI